MAQMCHIHRIPLHCSLPLFQLAVLHIPPSLYTTECKDFRSPSQVLLAEVLHYNHHHLLIENKDRVKKCSRKKPVDKQVQWWSYTPRYIYIFFISFDIPTILKLLSKSSLLDFNLKVKQKKFNCSS